MRKLIPILGLAFLVCIATDAAACSRCSTMPGGCDICYEATGDGGLDCYLTQGEYCTIVGPGQCEGVGDECETQVCPDDKWTSHAPPEPDREWQLASFEVIRGVVVHRRTVHS